MNTNKNILVAAPYELYRRGVKIALNDRCRRSNYRIYESDSLAESLPRRQMDLIILDSALVHHCGVSAMRRTIEKVNTPVLMFADQLDHEALYQARRIGASGLVSNMASLQEISEVTTELLNGEDHWPDPQKRSVLGCYTTGHQQNPTLTERQQEVLKQVRVGLSNKQIAYDLSISESTVKSHISEILRKFDVTTRTQLISRLGCR
ncbi:MAG: response regulator transcription factor [Oceanospirillaceae bacterium]|nr:response regulator transcription factor [Oceanospirillaceae bacterium]